MRDNWQIMKAIFSQRLHHLKLASGSNLYREVVLNELRENVLTVRKSNSQANSFKFTIVLL